MNGELRAWLGEGAKILVQVAFIAAVMWVKLDGVIEAQREVQTEVKQIKDRMEGVSIQLAKTLEKVIHVQEGFTLHRDKSCHSDACQELAYIRARIDNAIRAAQ